MMDPLDMNNYRIEKLPKMQKSGFEKILQRIGAPLAILAFIFIYWIADIPFINQIDTNKETTTLTESAIKRYDQMESALIKDMKTADGEQIKADDLTEQQQAQAEEEVADVAVLLHVDEDDAQEEADVADDADVERHTCRHDPGRQRGADIGSHNDTDGLRKSEQASIDERHGHHGGGG